MRAGLAAIALGIALAAPAQSGGTTAGQAIAVLNAQRAAAGIQPLKQDRAASRACAAHIRYERLNNVLTHAESPGRPGYTRAGARAAASADLAFGANWNHGDPFDNAPLHLSALLNPYLASVGFAYSRPWSCVTIQPPEAVFHAGPMTPVAYSYPANGTNNWRLSEVAGEIPFTPGDLLGLREPRRTGPYLIVMFAGPWTSSGGYTTVSSASLTGPRGKVQIKLADGRVPQHPGRPGTLGVFLGTKAMLIPVRPLSPHTTYTAHLAGKVVSWGGRPSWPVSDTFSFTTRR